MGLIGKRRDPKKLSPKERAAAISSLVDFVGFEGSTAKRRDGKYVALIEVQGEFFGLMSEQEQDFRLMAFSQFLTGVPWPVEITLIVESLDLSGYVDTLRENADRAESAVLKGIALNQADDIHNMADNVMSEAVLVSIVGETAADSLNSASQVVDLLRRNGFQAVQCSQERVLQIIYSSYGHIGQFPHDVFRPSWKTIVAEGEPVEQKTVKRGRSNRRGTAQAEEISLVRDDDSVLQSGLEQLPEVLYPAAVVESHGYIDLGGTFASTLVAVAYPERVYNGWLEQVLHFSYGSVRRRVAVYLDPIATDKAIGEISRKMVDLGVMENAAYKRGVRPDADTELALQDVGELRQDLAKGTQRMLEVTLLVTLMSDDLAELREAVMRLKQTAAGFMLVLRETYLEEQQGFRASMPLAVKSIKRSRPIPSIPVCTMFPFTSGELIHETGDFWGRNLLTGNVVIIDSKRYPAAHMIMVAATRNGKSYTFKSLCTQALLRGDEDVMIIDPSPPIDYRRWTEAMGGNYLRFGVGSGVRFNPCEIVPPLTFNPARPNEVDEELRRPVTQKVAFLKTIIEMMAYSKDGMEPGVKALVEQPLYAMYTELGITDEWQSLYSQGSGSNVSLRPQVKKSPTLRDALRHIADTPGLEDMALRLRPFVEGTLDMFSGETTADIDNHLVVFNVYSLAELGGQHLQAIAYAMIMEVIKSRLAAAGRRKMIGIDEAHIMFSNKETAKFMAKLYRMTGKQGGRVVLMTQSIVDLRGDPSIQMTVEGAEEAQVCLTNSGIVFLMHNDKQNDLRRIAETFNITEAETRFLAKAEPGQGLVIANVLDKALVETYATPELHKLITTRPEEVREIELAGAMPVRPRYEPDQEELESESEEELV